MWLVGEACVPAQLIHRGVPPAQECTCSAVAQASEVVENSVLVSPAVNALLEDIFKLVIEQYVESWYSL
jgi:hypothetical protein